MDNMLRRPPKGANTIFTLYPVIFSEPFGFRDTKEGDLSATGVTRGYLYFIFNPFGISDKIQHSFQPLIQINK
jgi:hypothetical protein